jgi:phosphate-selective porin OprO/OprP
MKVTRILIAAAVFTLTALAATTVFAQTEATPPLAASTNNVSAPVPASASFSDDADPAVQPSTKASSTYGPVSARRSGLWFSTQDGSTHLQVHGYVQADDRMFSANTKGEELDTFLFRRLRPLFEGTLFNQVDFRFMPDFGQNNPQIQEAFLELKTLPFAKVRVGKFKEPIGLEVLQADRYMKFPERSIASDLVPLRYIGAQLSGSILKNSISYEGGYFDGSSDGSNGEFTQWAQGNEGVGRVFLQPFAATRVNVLHQLGFGVAGSSGSQRGAISGLKTPGQTTFFKYSSSVVADGQHERISPQAYYYAGPFGLLGECTLSSQNVLNKGVAGKITNQAWQAQGSIVLTGEKNSYGVIRPRNSFEPNRGFRYMGAVELAARFAQLDIDGLAFAGGFAKATTAAQQAKETGVGVNWYLNQYVRLTTDYERTNFRMAQGAAPLHNENVLISMIQLAF